MSQTKKNRTAIKKTSVYVAVLNQGWLRVELAQQVIRLLCDPRYHLLPTGLDFPADSPVANNRNGIAFRMRATEADYLLMIDDDVVFTHNPLDWVTRDLDIVAFPCLCYKPEWADKGQWPLRWNIRYDDHQGGMIKEDEDDGKLRRVAGIGTGAMLIARRVLDHPAMRAPFMDIFNEDGLRTKGEDLHFCDRARDLGFSVYAALSSPCSHIKEMDTLLLQQAHRAQVEGLNGGEDET